MAGTLLVTSKPIPPPKPSRLSRPQPRPWPRIATRRLRRGATILTPSRSNSRACSARSRRCSARARQADMLEPAGSPDDARLQRALLAHLRQEFTAPAAAILGYAEMLIEDATRLGLTALLPDLERIQTAGASLQNLLQSVLAREGAAIDRGKLRHDLRTPMNAIKGYGEMLVEDAMAARPDRLVADLSRLLAAVQGVLARIDALVDFTGQPAGASATAPSLDRANVGGTLRIIRAAGLDAARASERGRILIVDDNAANRDLLGRRL